MAHIPHGQRSRRGSHQPRRGAPQASGNFSYVKLVGLEPRTFSEVREAVEDGLPFAALERLRKALHLGLGEIAELIGVPERTLLRRREAGRLERDESDRLLRAARVFSQAVALFEGDTDGARSWLSRPQPALAGMTPLAAAETEVGAREVERLIGRLEHGIPV